MTTDIVPTDPSTTPPPPTEAAMVTAYESLLLEMMALPNEALAPVNLDVTAAAGVAFAVAHRIPKYRPEVEQHLSAVIHLQAFDRPRRSPILHHPSAVPAAAGARPSPPPSLPPSRPAPRCGRRPRGEVV